MVVFYSAGRIQKNHYFAVRRAMLKSWFLHHEYFAIGLAHVQLAYKARSGYIDQVLYW